MVYEEARLTAKDSGAEWLIKGANLGFYFGLVFSYHEL
jgi:hypothetical protein